MADMLYAAGRWVERKPGWRETVDLGSAPAHQVYAAGVEDGYHLAIAHLRDIAQLMVEHLQAVEAEHCARRSGVAR